MGEQVLFLESFDEFFEGGESFDIFVGVHILDLRTTGKPGCSEASLLACRDLCEFHIFFTLNAQAVTVAIDMSFPSNLSGSVILIESAVLMVVPIRIAYRYRVVYRFLTAFLIRFAFRAILRVAFGARSFLCFAFETNMRWLLRE